MFGNDQFATLLLHGDGINGSTTITDNSVGGAASPHTVTANGSVVLDTAKSVFGPSSIKFPGAATDYLSIPASSDFSFGTGDFSIDLNIWFSSLANTTQYFFSCNGNTQDFSLDSGNTLRAILAGGSYSFPFTPSTGQGYHVAFTRNGTNIRAFVNGSQVGTTQTSSDNITAAGSNTWFMGTQFNHTGAHEVIGWMDEVRVSKGIARWTANFTAPNEPYDAPANPNMFGKSSESEARLLVRSPILVPYH